MNFLTSSVILLYVVTIKSNKNLHRLNAGAEALEDKRGTDNVQDLVGLIIFDDNNRLTRRHSKSHADDMKIWSRRSRKHSNHRRKSKKSKDISAMNEDFEEKQSSKRKKQKRPVESTKTKEKITETKKEDDISTVIEDFGDKVVDEIKSKKPKDKITETRIGSDISGLNDELKAFEEIVISQIKPKIGRNQYDNDCDCERPTKKTCLTETEKIVEKCNRACNRAHEDVCGSLRCSSRAEIGLRKECDFYCKKVFNPKMCYRRFL